MPDPSENLPKGPENHHERWPGAVKLPRSIDELRERLDWFNSSAADTAYAGFRPRPSDIIISTYPKCGTTWAQQIVHTLRTGGDMAFGEITEVVPWIEICHDLDMDANAEQRANPRAFKSHKIYSELPTGCRYLHITRDPERVAVSFYRFFNGWMMEQDAVDIDTFVTEMILGGTDSGTYWEHLLDWWPVRNNPDVLFLCYEDMLDSPADAIRTIAGFCAIALDAGLLETSLKQTSAEFMRAHSGKFDDNLVRRYRDPAMGLPAGGSSDKISKGDRSQATALSAETRDALTRRWESEIGSTLGFANYTALREAARST